MTEEALLRVLTDLGLLAGEILNLRRREALIERGNAALEVRVRELEKILELLGAKATKEAAALGEEVVALRTRVVELTAGKEATA